MKRILLPAIVVCVRRCCASRQPPVDPFYGRTTVPPPEPARLARSRLRRTTRARRRRAGNVAAGVAAAARRHSLALSVRPADLVQSVTPAPGPGGYRAIRWAAAPAYPGNSNGTIPYPSGGGAVPYPSGGGASMNSPGRWANVWTSASSSAGRTSSGFPPPARSAAMAVHRCTARSACRQAAGRIV